MMTMILVTNMESSTDLTSTLSVGCNDMVVIVPKYGAAHCEPYQNIIITLKFFTNITKSLVTKEESTRHIFGCEKEKKREKNARIITFTRIIFLSCR
jgi:hypothetical protein